MIYAAKSSQDRREGLWQVIMTPRARDNGGHPDPLWPPEDVIMARCASHNGSHPQLLWPPQDAGGDPIRPAGRGAAPPGDAISTSLASCGDARISHSR